MEDVAGPVEMEGDPAMAETKEEQTLEHRVTER